MTSNNLILIADGSRARLLSQDQRGHLMDLHSWRGQSDGQAGAQEAGSLFVGRVAEDLKQRIPDLDRLILVAAPKTLVDLRAELDDQILAKVEMQIDRDWTHLSLDELPDHLDKAISARR